MYDFDTVGVRNCTPTAVVGPIAIGGRRSQVPSVGDSFETETFGRKKKNADLPAGRQVFMMIKIN